VNALIDLPFALPTIGRPDAARAHGPQSPVGINVAFTTTSIVLAMLFVTLPFVVRTVQPVLIELDQEMEQAAKSLGATELQTFRRVVFPNILPGSSPASHSRSPRPWASSAPRDHHREPAVQDAGSSVFIFSRIESGDQAGAAAVAVILLAISFALLLAIGVVRHYTTRHDRG
jgi:sulfate transport system permease protein